MTRLATEWHDAMRRARALDPDRIAAHIVAAADSGLRATRYDAQGGRTTRVPCDDAEHCHDGPGPHSHIVASDPTGNAAVRGRSAKRPADLHALDRAVGTFVHSAVMVLDWVAGRRPGTWNAVLLADAALTPGTIAAGIDLDHEHQLPHHIANVVAAVEAIEAIATANAPRTPTIDEQHWTAGLADEDVCAWHLAVHRRYRRPLVGAYKGDRICADCMHLVLLGEAKPPAWLLEAEVDRMSKPLAWRTALGRWLDELGVRREAS